MKFSYKNRDGVEEYVKVAGDGIVDISDASENVALIYESDLEELIECLTRALNYIKEKHDERI